MAIQLGMPSRAITARPGEGWENLRWPPNGASRLYGRLSGSGRPTESGSKMGPSPNAQVAGFLFTAAKNGNVSAQIFWLKTRARWREMPVEMRHSGAIATRDLSELTEEDC